MSLPAVMIEQRQFKRIQPDWSGRLFVADSWFDCTVANVSGNGAWICTLARPSIDTGVVLFSEMLGMLAGTVARHDRDGISMTFGIGKDKKIAIVDQLTLYLNRQFDQPESADGV